jgi:hypothetical protein
MKQGRRDIEDQPLTDLRKVEGGWRSGWNPGNVPTRWLVSLEGQRTSREELRAMLTLVSGA